MNKLAKSEILGNIKAGLYNLNNKIAGEYHKKRKSQHELWASNGFEGSKDYFLYQLASELIESNYIASLTGDIFRVTGTNNKATIEDFEAIKVIYLQSVSSIIDTLFKADDCATLKIQKDSFARAIELTITSTIDKEAVYYIHKKDSKSDALARKSLIVASLALIISLMPWIKAVLIAVVSLVIKVIETFKG